MYIYIYCISWNLVPRKTERTRERERGKKKEKNAFPTFSSAASVTMGSKVLLSARDVDTDCGATADESCWRWGREWMTSYLAKAKISYTYTQYLHLGICFFSKCVWYAQYIFNIWLYKYMYINIKSNQERSSFSPPVFSVEIHLPGTSAFDLPLCTKHHGPKTARV